MGRVSEYDHDGGGSPNATALVVRADDEYDAALATLLAEAVRRPCLFVRIGRALVAAFKELHARKREEAECLESWYWYFGC